MLSETLLRLDDVPDLAPPVVVTGAEHRFLVAAELLADGIDAAMILLEPEGRNTAPALAAAALAHLAAGGSEDDVLVALPADHLIADVKAFQSALVVARKLAEAGRLVTFGVRPEGPVTGYGYIQRGEPLSEGGFALRRFTEKPDAEEAQRYCDSGEYLWNSGMFLFQVGLGLRELRRHSPEVAEACERAAAGIEVSDDFRALPAEDWARAPAISWDYAVMEHTDKAAVAPLDCGWTDVGSWAALWQASGADGDGNVVLGQTLALDCAGSYLRSEGRRLLATLGLRDMVVVAADDAVLVAPRARAEETRDLVEKLREAKRPEVESETRVRRPWGFYQSLENDDGFQVKRIRVEPGQQLSLQRHQKRAEHWVVIEGVATVQVDERTVELNVGESIDIPLRAWHRLGNHGDEALEIIEVQLGSYLGEDDIERKEDDYGRA